MSNFGKDIKDLFVNNLSMFPNASKRIRVWVETEKYRWKEDESVYNQKKGKTAPQYEVYFDSEFVCFIDSEKGKSMALITFLEAIRDLYKQEKIYINTEMYQVKQAVEEEKNRKLTTIELQKPTTPEDKMLTEIVKKSAKKRGKKVVLK